MSLQEDNSKIPTAVQITNNVATFVLKSGSLVNNPVKHERG